MPKCKPTIPAKCKKELQGRFNGNSVDVCGITNVHDKARSQRGTV